MDDPPAPLDDPAIRNLIMLISCALAGQHFSNLSGEVMGG
jgi:hypothetical protein